MPIRLYNTLTKTKEDFAPIDPANMRMYVCGPTVYDFAHIGNARPAIVFDVLFRLLKHRAAQGEWDGGRGQTKVTYVRNITDVDDKINARAAERGISIRELTEETARIYDEDIRALGCLPPTVAPRATEHIAQMIAMIEQLIAAGHAYAADGHVLFDVASKPDYGKLARRSLDEMIAGARVDVASYKKGEMDFVLWKPSDVGLPGWESPWGRGRPGWHIECSAMAGKYLGETFDIHGGGIDLMFPHHENEIAQSEGAHHGHPLAKVWMHNGFLQVEGEKMSKSLGNFFTIRQLLESTDFGATKWPGSVLRLAMLMTHYRQPIDWTIERLVEANRDLGRFARVWNEFHEQAGITSDSIKSMSPSKRVVELISDDLNMPEALTWIRAQRSAIFGAGKGHLEGLETSRQLMADLNFLGLYDEHLFSIPEIENEIRLAIAARNAARKAKNFAESDRIRDELLAKGIVLMDSPQGTTWEVKR